MIGPSMINTRPDNTSILHFCKTSFKDYYYPSYKHFNNWKNTHSKFWIEHINIFKKTYLVNNLQLNKGWGFIWKTEVFIATGHSLS